MGKITGLESMQDLPSKVLLLYEAVEQLIVEGVDINDIRVSTITDKAGIGKGTAYDYFESKEDILACAVTFYMRKAVEEMNLILSKRKNFAEQVAFLLDEITKSSAKPQCLIRCIHVITDTSAFSRLVREKLHMEEARKYLPTGVFAEMVEKAKKRGEVRNDLPVDYMVYILFSKIMSYMMCVGEDGIVGIDIIPIRPLIYQSILDELCEKKA